jgi:hypothetical protein
MQNFIVVDDKIFIKSYARNRDDEVEFIILDLKGNLIKKKYIPDVKHNHYAIKNNTFYFLKENEEEEIWELYYMKM